MIKKSYLLQAVQKYSDARCENDERNAADG